MGHVRWQLALSLLGAWILVCLCLIKGIKSQGKVSSPPACSGYFLLSSTNRYVKRYVYTLY